MVHVHIIDSIMLDEEMLSGLSQWGYEDIAIEVTKFTSAWAWHPRSPSLPSKTKRRKHRFPHDLVDQFGSKSVVQTIQYDGHEVLGFHIMKMRGCHRNNVSYIHLTEFRRRALALIVHFCKVHLRVR